MIYSETGMEKLPASCQVCEMVHCPLPGRETISKPYRSKRHRDCPLREGELTVGDDAARREEIAGKDREIARVVAERDTFKQALHLAIETHSIEPRQIERLERYYLKQARGARGEG